MKKNLQFKHILSLAVMILLIMGGGMNLMANGTLVDGIYYTFSGNEATVTYTGATYSATSSYTGDIIIPSSVDYDNKTYTVVAIASNAFYNASSVTSITLPTTLTTINSTAFDGCSSLTSINIPENVTSIGMNAFRNCTALANVVYNATSCGNLNSGAFTASTAAIFTLTIGDNVTSIPNSLFANTTHLTTVTIPASVVTIGNYAFSGCSGLTTLIIGEGVTTINKCAFQNCTGLTSVTLNATLTTIPTSSSEYAFKGCSCNNPCTLTVGATVTSIPNFTFGSLSNVTTVYFNATTCSDFSTSMNSAMPSVPGSEPYASLYIGDNVTRIPAGMFKSKKLAHITIGSSVTAIGDEAFNSTNSITSEIISKPSTPPTTGTNSFQLVNKNKPTYVPAGTASTYQAATGWSSFTNYIEFPNFTSNTEIDGTTGSSTLPVMISGDAILTIGSTGKLTCSDVYGATVDNLIIADGGQLVCNNSVAATVQKTTKEFTATAKEEEVHNWYAISSPVANVAIASFVPADPAEDWNVYQYDEGSHFWEEYRDPANKYSNLENGRGYLYRSTVANIAFSGNTNVTKAEYTLSYTPENGAIAGLHLIGNPYTHNIYKGENTAIDSDNLEDGFYTLKEDGGWQPGNDNEYAIAPTQGILVQAKSGADGHTLEITNTTAAAAKSGNDNIMFTVKNAKYSDVAYVLFKEGHGLNKIEHRNAEIPMLYVNKEGEDFAIADMADDTKVIYLGFEAKTMSQYTLSLKANGQYSYMHLYDKVAGEDIDMLVEDSYTFIGSPSDRKDRFTLNLTYDADIEEVEANTVFVYQNGNDIVVNGEGELHVFDMMGRMVMTTTVNGVETVSGLNNGVYVFRMGGKTQKVVVR